MFTMFLDMSKKWILYSSQKNSFTESSRYLSVLLKSNFIFKKLKLLQKSPQNFSNLIQHFFNKKSLFPSLWKVLWNSVWMILFHCPFHQKQQTIACSMMCAKNVNATFEKHSDPAIGINCCENGLKKALKEQKVMEKHMKKLQALGKLHWCVENTDAFAMNP